MYLTSEAYKAAVVQHARTWALDFKLTLDSGEVIDLDETKVSLGTTKFKEASTCSDNIQVGSVFANSLNFAVSQRLEQTELGNLRVQTTSAGGVSITSEPREDITLDDAGNATIVATGASTIWSDDSGNVVVEASGSTTLLGKDFSNAIIVAKVGLLVDGAYEWVPLGKFNVVTANKKLSSVTLSCLDDMYKLNRSLSEISISFPCSVYALTQNICSSCGVSMTPGLSLELQTLSTQIEAFDTEDYTCRDVLSFVGMLLGKNMRFNRAGYLEAFWYSDSGQTTTTDTRASGASFEDYQVHVTGVAVVDKLNQTYVVGSDDYLLELKLNPLIQDEAHAQTVANKLLDVLSSITYAPYKAKYIGDPSWQAGDVLSHERNGQVVATSPIMEHTFTFRGTSQLNAVGKAPGQIRQLTSAAKILQSVKTEISKDLNQGLTSMEQTILNQTALITNALGFYPRVSQNADGSIAAYYLMSTPEDTATTTVWAFTSGGIGVSHTGVAGPYTSSWTADDSIVAQVITASMIRAGILQSRDGGATFYLDLDNGILRMDASEVLIGSKNVAETLNEMQNNTGSLSSRVEELATDTSDRLSGLETSLSLKMDSSAVQVQITEAMKDGVTKVDTTTGIRMDAAGVTVDKTGASTSTNINENGMLVSRKTGGTLEAVLTANDQGVDAINLTARQYLIIGTRSRFENYGTDRTGCFWIG